MMFKLEDILDSIGEDEKWGTVVHASPSKIYPAYLGAAGLPRTVLNQAAAKKAFIKDCIKKFRKVRIKITKDLDYATDLLAAQELRNAGADFSPATVAGYVEKKRGDASAIAKQIGRKLDRERMKRAI